MFSDLLYRRLSSVGAVIINPPLVWHPPRHDLTDNISILVKAQWFSVPPFALHRHRLFNSMNQPVSSSMKEINRIIRNETGLLTSVATALAVQGLEELEYHVFSEYCSLNQLRNRYQSLEVKIRQPFQLKGSTKVQHPKEFEADERELGSMKVGGVRSIELVKVWYASDIVFSGLSNVLQPGD